MTRSYASSAALFFVLLALSGCIHNQVSKAVLPAHDDVLVYELPFDLVYLRTLEALENVDNWELEETEKEKGIIIVRNVNFSNFTDADKRLIKVLITRVSRNETTVKLAEESQHVLGGDKLLTRITEHVGQEL